MKGIGLIKLFCLLISFSVAGQGNFSAVVSQSEVVAGEIVELKFIIENMKGDFEPPNFAPFEQVAGPMQSSSFQSINGQISEMYSFTYILQAPEEGVYLISEAELLVEDQAFYTDPIEILVLPSGRTPSTDRQDIRQKSPSLQQILKGKIIKRF